MQWKDFDKLMQTVKPCAKCGSKPSIFGADFDINTSAETFHLKPLEFTCINTLCGKDKAVKDAIEKWNLQQQ